MQGKSTGEDTYKLNIHEHTERGDNATVKKLDSRVQSFKDIRLPFTYRFDSVIGLKEFESGRYNRDKDQLN